MGCCTGVYQCTSSHGDQAMKRLVVRSRILKLSTIGSCHHISRGPSSNLKTSKNRYKRSRELLRERKANRQARAVPSCSSTTRHTSEAPTSWKRKPQPLCRRKRQPLHRLLENLQRSRRFCMPPKSARDLHYDTTPRTKAIKPH